eukprot:300872_1
MFNPQDVAKVDCNDLSILATFQSIVYGNDSLIFAEKKSFGSVVSTPTSNTVTPKSANQTPTFKHVPISLALTNIQNSLDAINKCKHLKDIKYFICHQEFFNNSQMLHKY